MRLRLLIALLLFINVQVKADYGYMSLSELIKNADYVAIGTIVKLDINYFWLKVDKLILGKVEADTIPIMRFQDWNCAVRYSPYNIGQKEVVFFRKSNNAIQEFEYLGYGGGGEFELPIFGDSVKYSYHYNRSRAYLLNDLLNAVRDYHSLKSPSEINKEFTDKSSIHELLTHRKEPVYEYETGRKVNGSISNIETKFLYEGYNNKIEISLESKNSWDVFLEVDDAEVHKEEDFFIVNPKGGWSRRWLNVKGIDSKGDTVLVSSEIFDVYPVPSPTLYIGHYFTDSIPKSATYSAVPKLKYTIGDRQNDLLTYTVLTFDVTVVTKKGNATVKCKSEYGNLELKELLRTLVPRDKIVYSNITAQYPDGSIHNVPGKEVYVYKEE